MTVTLAVTTPATRALIKAAELADHIGKPGDGSFAIVNAALAASKVVESYCGVEFTLQTYQEVWRDRPSCVVAPYDLYLKRQHVVDPLVSVVDAASATVPSADYELIDPKIGLIRFYESGSFTLDSDRWKLTITYQAGFSEAPHDLKRAVLEVGQNLYRNAGSSVGNVQSESIGDWSVTYGRAFISGPVRGILDNYRVKNVW